MKPFHSKPHFQTTVDQQRLANYRLSKESVSLNERNNLERKLQPVRVEDIELPKCPLVRLIDTETKSSFERWIVLAEIAQTPGKVILLNINNGQIETNFSADMLELVPPTELP